MRRALAVVATLAVVAALAPAASGPSAGQVRELVLYGHVKSLTPEGARFELRFDPALFLTGETARRAAVEDGALPPGEPVANDYYIRDETHRLLTFRVPTTARVTVITRDQVRQTRIAVAELAQIVKGKNPKHRRLYEPQLGYWIHVSIDTVRSFEQQYQP